MQNIILHKAINDINSQIYLNENFIKNLYNKVKSGNTKSIINDLKEKHKQSLNTMNDIKNTYRKVYNMDVDRFENDIKRVVNDNVKGLKEAVIKKDSQKQRSIFKKIIVGILRICFNPAIYYTKSIQDIPGRKKDPNKDEKITKSIISFGILFAISIIFVKVLAYTLISPVAYFVITALVFAPIVEEYFKRMSIKNDFGDQYITVFSFAEFFLYMLPTLATNNPEFIGIMLIFRYLAMVMHFATYDLQKYFIQKFKNKKTGEDSKKDLAGYTFGTIMHSFYNFGMTIVANSV